jgi:hypothetical protein
VLERYYYSDEENERWHELEEWNQLDEDKEIKLEGRSIVSDLEGARA